MMKVIPETSGPDEGYLETSRPDEGFSRNEWT
jgi:hypothetical protein